jgi:patatin-related protein
MDIGIDFTQEVRFAVVMYGGSSLAIYMNGVAQELLHLVRATAPSPLDQSKPYFKAVNGTEAIYRKIGRMLSRAEKPKLELAATDEIRTRFVIDILSGTSAGGINAVFLAKALANDCDLDTLARLWLNIADMGKLMNDDEDPGFKPVGPQVPPRSLLNSPRLYYELLDALDRMDDNRGRPKPPTSPYMEELDLYTTATDVQGLTIQLKLADMVAAEQRHLNKFHFKYRSLAQNESDFERPINPFLAFAARCTSAHPAAFEPVKLSDIDPVLAIHGDTQGYSADQRWQKFYEDYLSTARRDEDRTAKAKDFQDRPFIDGGVLDNSPFTFALDELPLRQTELPTERRLLYVEPVPEHPELQQDKNERPDLLKNVYLSLSALPSYQTIHDDLQRVLDRNRLIERVGRIIQGVEQDEIERMRAQGPTKALTADEFLTASLTQMIERMGSAWGGYQRLRVSETTDELAAMLSRGAGFPDGSAETAAMRYLVRAWRSANYSPYPKDGKAAETKFLFQYDVKWLIRRLKFVLKKADEMTCFDDHAGAMLQLSAQHAAGLRSFVSSKDSATAPDLRHSFRKFMKQKKGELNGALQGLLQLQYQMMALPITHPLAAILRSIDGDTLRNRIMKEDTEAARIKAGERFLKEQRAVVDELATKMDDMFKTPLKEASARAGAKGALKLPDAPPADFDRHYVAVATLRYYYDFFDRYDMISYPILYATDVGEETGTIEVFRIGPEDAELLVPNPNDRRRKLAGTYLDNFGALLEERFRANDMLWGRLDAAERIITALLRTAAPVEEQLKIKIEEARRKLTAEAQTAILAEEHDKLKEVLGKETSFPDKEQESNLRASLSRAEVNGPLQDYMVEMAIQKDPLKAFQNSYSFEHVPSPEILVHTAGRASRVIGKMLDDIADHHPLLKSRIGWLTRLLTVFWALVEVAIPGSVGNLVIRHSWKLLYFFEGLMILGGTLLINPSVQQFGFVALALTLGLHAVVLLLNEFMRGRALWRRAFIVTLITAGGLIFAAGIILMLSILGVGSLWPAIAYFNPSEPGVFLRVTLARFLFVLILAAATVLALWRR